MNQTDKIRGYHAHLYYQAGTMAQARALADAAEAAFDLVRGRMHERPVGPHPMWSCQLACAPDVFAQLLPWLALNRGEVIVFAHPDTGDDLPDHRDHAIWLGGYLPLNLDVFDNA